MMWWRCSWARPTFPNCLTSNKFMWTRSRPSWRRCVCCARRISPISELDEQKLYAETLSHHLRRLAVQEAEEEKRRKELNSLKFSQGKNAYSTGEYATSLTLFQQALDQEGIFTPLGGEIQLWLALSFQVKLLTTTIVFILKKISSSPPPLPPWYPCDLLNPVSLLVEPVIRSACSNSPFKRDLNFL